MKNNGNPGATTIDRRIDQIKDSVKGLVDQGQERVNQIKDKVVDAKQQAVSKGTAYIDRATDLIKANPLKSVAIAFGAGYIGMRLFRR